MMIVGLGLTVLGLALNLYALRSTRQQADALGVITASVSTRFIGRFPEFVPDIARLIDSAKESVSILVDLPAYGLTSNIEGWHEMEEALRRQSRSGKRVSITLYTEAERRRILEDQSNHRPFLENPEVRQALGRILKLEDDARSVEELDESDVIRLCLARHKNVVRESFSHVTSTKEKLPIYCWVVDQREAIFAIPIFAGDSTEYGFRTSDGQLVAALLQMQERVKKRA